MNQNSERKKKLGSSIFFLNSAGRILMLLRDDKPWIPYPNCWDVPGGCVEPGETPEECIRREMLEEIEVELDNPRPFNIYDMDDRLEHTFWTRADFDLAILPLHEGQRLQWFSEDEILRMPEEQIAFGFKPVIHDFYSRKPWLSRAAED